MAGTHPRHPDVSKRYRDRRALAWALVVKATVSRKPSAVSASLTELAQLGAHHQVIILDEFSEVQARFFVSLRQLSRLRPN
jgi:hypothetical protein